MVDQLFNNPLSFLFWLIALIVGITVHEFAHAWAAERLGDPTPRLMGRLTLNPLAHLDPLGTLMLLIARFGWGKPVVFDPFNLRHPRRDAAFISLAGPTANLLLTLVASLLLNLLFHYKLILIGNAWVGLASVFLTELLKTVIVLNVILAVFNLIPIHPLDGFKIVGGLLPEKYAKQWAELQPYGLIFLIFLIFPFFGSSPISKIISPIINFLLRLLLSGTPLI